LNLVQSFVVVTQLQERAFGDNDKALLRRRRSGGGGGGDEYGEGYFSVVNEGCLEVGLSRASGVTLKQNISNLI
jgi:hypothetical protein